MLDAVSRPAGRLRLLLRSHWPLIILAIMPFAILWRLWTPNPLDQAFIWQDVTDSVLPNLVFVVDSIHRSREIPLWAWGVYSGLPFSTTFFNFVMYPFCLPFILGWLDPASARVYHVFLIGHLAVAGITTYALLRAFAFRRSLTFMGAVVYECGGFVTYAIVASPAWLMAHAWLPMLFLSIKLFVQSGRVRWLFAFVASVYLLLCTALPLLVLPLAYFAVAFLASVLWIERRHVPVLRSLLCLGAAALLVVCLHAAQLLPMFELSQAGQGQFSTSQYLYARDKWGEQTAVRFISEFLLGGDLAKSYVSALGVFMVIAGALVTRHRYRGFWVAAFVCAVVVSFLRRDFAGYDLVYFLPLLGNLPAIDRPLGSAYLLAASFLFTAGASRVLGALRANRLSAATAGLTVAVVAGLAWFTLRPDEAKALDEFRRAFLAWLISAGMGLAIVASRPGRRRNAAVAIALLVLVLDAMAGFMRNFDARLRTRAEVSTSDILVDSPYVIGRSSTAKLPSVLTARIERPRASQSLIQGPDNVAGRYAWQFGRNIQSFSAANFTDGYMFQGPLAPRLDRDLRWPQATVQQLFDLGDGRLGRAWVVPAPTHVHESPLLQLMSDEFDARTTAYLEVETEVIRREFGDGHAWLTRALQGLVPDYRVAPSAAPLGKVSDGVWLLRQTPNSIAFMVDRGGTLVFSDAWYPGWCVYVDGKRAPLFVANYNFKAVTLRGAATVEFVFDPPLVRLGRVIALAGGAGLVVLGFAARRRTARRYP